MNGKLSQHLNKPVNQSGSLDRELRNLTCIFNTVYLLRNSVSLKWVFMSSNNVAMENRTK